MKTAKQNNKNFKLQFSNKVLLGLCSVGLLGAAVVSSEAWAGRIGDERRVLLPVATQILPGAEFVVNPINQAGLSYMSVSNSSDRLANERVSLFLNGTSYSPQEIRAADGTPKEEEFIQLGLKQMSCEINFVHEGPRIPRYDASVFQGPVRFKIATEAGRKVYIEAFKMQTGSGLEEGVEIILPLDQGTHFQTATGLLKPDRLRCRIPRSLLKENQRLTQKIELGKLSLADLQLGFGVDGIKSLRDDLSFEPQPEIPEHRLGQQVDEGLAIEGSSGSKSGHRVAS